MKYDCLSPSTSHLDKIAFLRRSWKFLWNFEIVNQPAKSGDFGGVHAWILAQTSFSENNTSRSMSISLFCLCVRVCDSSSALLDNWHGRVPTTSPRIRFTLTTGLHRNKQTGLQLNCSEEKTEGRVLRKMCGNSWGLTLTASNTNAAPSNQMSQIRLRYNFAVINAQIDRAGIFVLSVANSIFIAELSCVFLLIIWIAAKARIAGPALPLLSVVRIMMKKLINSSSFHWEALRWDTSIEMS